MAPDDITLTSVEGRLASAVSLDDHPTERVADDTGG
jgi:hypothetical protein